MLIEGGDRVFYRECWLGVLIDCVDRVSDKMW